MTVGIKIVVAGVFRTLAQISEKIVIKIATTKNPRYSLSTKCRNAR